MSAARFMSVQITRILVYEYEEYEVFFL
jgi:hypothetical protein